MTMIPNARRVKPPAGGGPLSGTFSHGQSVTLTGSGFGTKSTAAPIKYDDFQSVTIGQTIWDHSTAPGPSWGNLGDQEYNPIANNTKLRAGTPFARNMDSHWEFPNAGDSAGSALTLAGQTARKLYFDGWMYLDDTGITSGSIQNFKPVRFESGTTSAYFNPYSNSAGDYGGNVRDGVTRVDSDWASDPSSSYYNAWNHVQWMADAGSGDNAYDGACHFYRNCGLKYSHVDIAEIGSGEDDWNTFYLGNYIRSNDQAGHIHIYWESMYVDDSWARVEIGDEAVYDDCTHREIQRCTAWSDGSITFVPNRGNFGPTDNVTIFVINESNTVVATQAATLGTTY